MEENFLFLLQSAKLIKSGDYNQDDIDFINELVLSIDNDLLIDYNSNITISSLGNDLDFYIKVVKFLIKYFEDEENYESCFFLKKKLDESLDIKTKKLTENEHIKNV
jgi:hypothetical protein